jgi:hypothetical protein
MARSQSAVSSRGGRRLLAAVARFGLVGLVGVSSAAFGSCRGASRSDSQVVNVPRPSPQPQREVATKPIVAEAATPRDECTLEASVSILDVHADATLQVRIHGNRIDQTAIELDKKRLPTTGVTTRSEADGTRVFSASWTSANQPDGKHQIQAICSDASAQELARSDLHTIWISNKLGSMLGTNGSLSREHVDKSVELGVTWLRGGPEWGFHPTEADFARDVEAKKRGVTWPGLNQFRDEAEYAHRRGLRILVPAMGASEWARGKDRTDGGTIWHQAILPPMRKHFAEYVKQLCAEGADAVEIINEPNLRSEYSFGPSHPRAAHPDERVDDYVLLLREVYEHVKADPATATCQVGLGGTSASGHEMIPDPTFIHPVEWYRRLFHSTADDRTTPISAKGFFDFASLHPYADANVRAGPTEWGHRWLRFSLQYGDAAYGHGMAMVIRIRRVLVEEGAADRKIWATEVGLPTFGGTCTNKPCASEKLQAIWVHQYVRAWFSTEATGWNEPLAPSFYGDFTGPMIYYQLQDRSDGRAPPTDKEGFFGLLRHDRSPKPSFGALRSEASRARGALK